MAFKPFNMRGSASDSLTDQSDWAAILRFSSAAISYIEACDFARGSRCAGTAGAISAFR
jgi:hypothetical protein